ncbi:MAG: threonine synthase [Deltaproteobacteria bacterium]|nr:threonine synthase [Deltaproteobacteria bacterium]
MRLEDFPQDIQPHLIPQVGGDLIYRCLGCGAEFSVDELWYTCPACSGVFMIIDRSFDVLKKKDGWLWQKIFDYRKMLNLPAVKGIFRYQELVGPNIPLSDVVYLGEGHTPLVKANVPLETAVGAHFYYKNDGQNPSASFKDRGMAVALSFINHLVKKKGLSNLLSICASTGDTSASAALYSAYLAGVVKSSVLLPHGKVTPQQLAQPLGSGANVFEVPGVFDDCMKIVENLADNYHVALLNSKNAWRIKGQESYSYEIAQDFDYQVADKAVFVPIGNAGNITAVMSGFINFMELGIIDGLPKVVGVQSEHADPVYRYYLEPDNHKRKFEPVAVKPSVAQAAMIGNPVSMPRVIQVAGKYNELAGRQRVFVVQTREQEIMDWMMRANRHGHIACTQGGESLAGLAAAVRDRVIDSSETAVLDATAHMLKFIGFQELYFQDSFPPEFQVKSKKELINQPRYVHPAGLAEVPLPGRPLTGDKFDEFVRRTAGEIAQRLGLEPKN